MYGTARKLLKIVKWKPGRLYGCLDSSGPLIRQQVYPEYKSWRSDSVDEQLHANLNELLTAFGGKTLQAHGVEADDLIAWVRQYHEDEPAVIVAGDSDLFGLIDEDTVVEFEAGAQEKRQGRWTLNRFRDEYEFGPNKYAAFRALKGDRSDGVPGIEGIGEVTARKIVKGVESAPDTDRYRTFKDVLRLRPDDVRETTFEPNDWDQADWKDVRDLFQRWGFSHLL